MQQENNDTTKKTPAQKQEKQYKIFIKYDFCGLCGPGTGTSTRREKTGNLNFVWFVLYSQNQVYLNYLGE